MYIYIYGRWGLFVCWQKLDQKNWHVYMYYVHVWEYIYVLMYMYRLTCIYIYICIYLYLYLYLCIFMRMHIYICIHMYVYLYVLVSFIYMCTPIHIYCSYISTSFKMLIALIASITFSFKVGLCVSRTNVDSQWNPVFNAFHRFFCCGNETILR